MFPFDSGVLVIRTECQLFCFPNVRKAFITEHRLAPRQVIDPNRYFSLVYNLRHNGRDIVEYVEVHSVSGRPQAVFRLPACRRPRQQGEKDMIQVYLHDKPTMLFSRRQICGDSVESQDWTSKPF